MRPLATMLLVAACLLVGGCTEAADEPENPAVEAQEQNLVTVGAFQYRVSMFRQLAVDTPGDDQITLGLPEGEGGLYAAFVRACNVSDEPAVPSRDIELQNAFGEEFPKVETDSDLTYQPREVAPGECIPETSSVAEVRWEGAPVVYRVPFDATSERPFVLSIIDRSTEGEDPEQAAIELDL